MCFDFVLFFGFKVLKYFHGEISFDRVRFMISRHICMRICLEKIVKVVFFLFILSERMTISI